jgi:hypothetical protein
MEKKMKDQLAPPQKSLMTRKPKTEIRKHIIQTKVMDFTIWNGIMFGFGLAMGVAAFGICIWIIAFALKISFLGLFTLFSMSIPQGI